jgi:hypothetical protein
MAGDAHTDGLKRRTVKLSGKKEFGDDKGQTPRLLL